LSHEQCMAHVAHGSTTTAVTPAAPERHCAAFSTSASGASASCSGAAFGALPGAMLPGMLTPAGCPGFLKPAGRSAVLRTAPALAGPALRRKQVPDLSRASA